MEWEDGGPLDLPERGDYASAVEQARAWQSDCPDCGGAVSARDGDDGLRCASVTTLAGGACEWETSDEDLVERWAEAREP